MLLRSPHPYRALPGVTRGLYRPNPDDSQSHNLTIPMHLPFYTPLRVAHRRRIGDAVDGSYDGGAVATRPPHAAPLLPEPPGLEPPSIA